MLGSEPQPRSAMLACGQSVCLLEPHLPLWRAARITETARRSIHLTCALSMSVWLCDPRCTGAYVHLDCGLRPDVFGGTDPASERNQRLRDDRDKQPWPSGGERRPKRIRKPTLHRHSLGRHDGPIAQRLEQRVCRRDQQFGPSDRLHSVVRPVSGVHRLRRRERPSAVTRSC
jgi:hypothetical protein